MENARFSPQIGHAGRMGNTRRILSAALLVAVLCALTWLALQLGKPDQPDYEGKKLSAWLQDIDYGQPQAKREKAAEAIRSMGTNTLPFLLDDLDVARQSRLKEYLIQLARKQSLFKLNWRDANERSRQATWAFKALGSAGSPAIQELLRLEESNPGYVPGALAGIGVVALPYLIQGLTNKNEWVRGNAAAYLANAVSDRSIPSSEAKMALALLIGNLRDTNNNVRPMAASALKTIDPEAAAKAGVQ
jgi:HEAT repeat protein